MFANPLLSKQHYALLPKVKLLRKVNYEMYGMAPQETHENFLYTVVLFLLILEGVCVHLSAVNRQESLVDICS